MEKFYKSIESKNTVDAPLLKIGAGSGFLATTIGLKIKEYDVVGLNVGQVENMRDAIRDYVTAIQTHLNGINALADANNAFKHTDVQGAMEKYIDTVKSYCMNLVSQLLAFSDKLGDVKNTYEANMQSLSNTINTKNTAFDAGTQYQETIQ